MASAEAISPARTSFYPPRIVPPAKLPGRPLLLFRLLSDSLRCIPESVYREPIVVFRRRPAVAYVTDPDLIRTILVDRRELFPKPELQKLLLRPLAGDGLLLAEGQNWRWQRLIAAPLFKHAEIMVDVPVMVACAERLVEQWRMAAPASVHAIDKDMTRVTYDVISHTVLAGCGAEFGEMIAEGAARYFSGATWSYLFALLELPTWLPRPGRRVMRLEKSRLRRTIGEMIRRRRATTGEARDLFSRLVHAAHPETGERMSDEQLVDNLLTFLIAGHDTTAKALTWTLYLVSKSPEWETRMLEEIERFVPSGPITGQHIDKLVIVQQVLKEGMRLYPSFPETSRVAARDVELGGEFIAAGTFIDLPIYAIHRHHKLWDDPDRFDPGRFALDNVAKHSRYQFMPFGGGPRVCIGAAFALSEGTALLATFVRAARFRCPPGFEPVPVARLSLAPKGGMPLQVTMRNCSPAKDVGK